MKSFKEFNILNEEPIGITLSRDLIPRKVLHWLKRVLHKDKYKGILKLQHQILSDKSRKISAEQALVKAAETFGIKPREMMKVMDKETRYA